MHYAWDAAARQEQFSPAFFKRRRGRGRGALVAARRRRNVFRHSLFAKLFLLAYCSKRKSGRWGPSFSGITGVRSGGNFVSATEAAFLSSVSFISPRDLYGSTVSQKKGGVKPPFFWDNRSSKRRKRCFRCRVPPFFLRFPLFRLATSKVRPYPKKRGAMPLFFWDNRSSKRRKRCFRCRVPPFFLRF